MKKLISALTAALIPSLVFAQTVRDTSSNEHTVEQLTSSPVWLKLSIIDRDLDGILNIADAFPDDRSEYADSDGDGLGNNADKDDDNDGVPDIEDVFPLNPAETSDLDNDGIGDNSDIDVNGDGVIDALERCGIAAQKEFVADVVTDWYYWYDEVANVAPQDFAEPESFLRALVHPITSDGSGRDPGFSYLTTVEADRARFTSGTYYGFGFKYSIVDGSFYFADTYEGAPAYESGLRRGHKLLAVDLGSGFETWEQLVARGASSSEIFGASDEQTTRTFRVQSDSGILEVTATKAEVTTPPIAGEPTLIHRAGKSPAGYLHFRRFIDSADQPLRNAATLFANSGVTDIVIDLRYNGGGLVRIAETFLNLLGGEVADNATSYIINRNDKKQLYNSTASFEQLPETIAPIKVAFITRGSTASASELIINSLEPHIEVVLVGNNTYGKAVGQSAFDMSEDCETRLRLISFEIQNGEGQGGYYTGLVDTGRFALCPALDDVTRKFGDENEASLKTALQWLNEDLTCSVPLQKQSRNIKPIVDDWPIDQEPPIDREGGVRSF
jgi:C-terminal processing protease CtpA/Prc